MSGVCTTRVSTSAGGQAVRGLMQHERQILDLIARGLTSARIGKQLHLSTEIMRFVHEPGPGSVL